jgi:hypothetical protein
MKRFTRLVLLSTTLIALASGLAFAAAANRTDHGNRLEATFSETLQSITNRTADLGTLQLISTGTGTVEGFGAATVVVGITGDHSVTPCGPGSWANAATRRIVLDDGVLVLGELSIACPSPTGLIITGTYQVDGLSSTGIFAGASGTGELTANGATHSSTLSGKLHLANGGD